MSTSHHGVTDSISAAICCRVSTEEQRERQSIGTQVDFARRYCELHEIPVADYYTDDGVTGTIALDQRPEGQRLLNDARTGKFRLLLVYRLDRLGRDARHILNAVAEFEALGVQVKSMTEPFDTSEPVGRFMVTMLSGIAGLERDTIVARGVAGTERSARNGVWLGGHAPFGYRIEGKGKAAHLAIAEEPIPGLDVSEAEVVRRMYRMLGEERLSCRKVAEFLNSNNIPTVYYRLGVARKQTRNGLSPSGVWTPQRVRNLLVMTVYKGIHQWGKRDGQDKAGREIIERPSPALVSEALWQRAQESLRTNRLFSPRNAKHQYLLRGMIRCGLCGMRYSGMTSADGHSYYRCPAKHRYGSAALTAKGVRCVSRPICGNDVERAVWEDIESFLRNPGDVLATLQERQREQEDHPSSTREEIAQHERRLITLDRERDTILSLYRKGRIAEYSLNRQLDQIAAEEVSANTALLALRAELHGKAAVAKQLASAETMLRELHRRLDAGITWEVKRQLVETLVAGVRVDTVERDGQTMPEVHVAYRFGAIDASSARRGGCRCGRGGGRRGACCSARSTPGSRCIRAPGRRDTRRDTDFSRRSA